MNKLATNTIRVLGVEAIQKANSGHPGIVLGAAPIINTLFTKIMNITPNNPTWINRDRFILAAGHGSAMLYTTLHLAGYKITIEDLKQFRQLNSLTPGHPEYKHTDGIDATSGPLGQGIAMGVGMAISETYLNELTDLIDHYTYVLCGDGDLQEGITQEAISLAGHLKLSKLIVLYDSNDIQLDGPLKMANSENSKQKYEAMNWNYLLITDGNNEEEIEKAINAAKKQDKPTIIEIKTIIGYGASNAGSADTHGAPLGEAGVASLKENLNHSYEAFEVDQKVYDYYQEHVVKRGDIAYKNWLTKFEESANKDLLNKMMSNEFEDTLDEIKFDLNFKDATRNTTGKFLDLIQKANPSFIGGSADLTKSTKIKGINGDFEKDSRLGRNINYGVREHAMGAIVNGITLHGATRGFGSGFLIFSDYLKPSIRMAALMNIPSLFIFSHDSIAVGEDGPTHQPVEQLVSLRSIPNTVVFRPANILEAKYAFKYYLTSQKPVIIASSRQDLTYLQETSYNEFIKGAYIALKETKKLELVIIATGSELELAINTATKHGNIRVISLTSTSLITREYMNELAPVEIPRIICEAGTKYSFIDVTTANTKYLTQETFGFSGPYVDVLNHCGYTEENLNKIIGEIKC